MQAVGVRVPPFAPMSYRILPRSICFFTPNLLHCFQVSRSKSIASILPRKDRDGNIIGWQARVRKKGYPLQVKTFDRKGQAQTWAKQLEVEMERGVWQDRSESEQTPLTEALDRYGREVSSLKKAARLSYTESVRSKRTPSARSGRWRCPGLRQRRQPRRHRDTGCLEKRRRGCLTAYQCRRLNWHHEAVQSTSSRRATAIMGV